MSPRPTNETLLFLGGPLHGQFRWVPPRKRWYIEQNALSTASVNGPCKVKEVLYKRDIISTDSINSFNVMVIDGGNTLKLYIDFKERINPNDI